MVKHTTPAEDLANVTRALAEIQHRQRSTEAKIEPQALFGMVLSLPTFLFAVLGAIATVVVVVPPLIQLITKFWLG